MRKRTQSAQPLRVEPSKIVSLTIVERTILGVLMKYKEAGIARRDACAKVMALGAVRKRRRSQFIETNVWEAMARLLAADLIKTWDETEEAIAGELGAYPVNSPRIGMGMTRWYRAVNYVKLTVEGWIVAAQKNLGRLCR